jgi:hypothetical protein
MAQVVESLPSKRGPEFKSQYCFKKKKKKETRLLKSVYSPISSIVLPGFTGPSQGWTQGGDGRGVSLGSATLERY